MYVNVEAKALAKALKITNAIIEPRNTIPILSTVKLSYSSAGLTVEGTDLDMHVKLTVDEIDGQGEFSTCIAASYLASIVSAAGVASMRIEPTTIKIPKGKGPADNGEFYEKSGVAITHGYASYEVEALPASDFPDIAGDRAGRIERFTNGMFTAMLRKVEFCISKEETRYYLNGVAWQSRQDGKRFAATDGHRLAICRYAGDGDPDGLTRIIPRKTVALLLKHLDGLDIDVHQIVKGNAPADHLIDFIAPGIELRTKLIDGAFPDVDRVIPKNNKHTLKLNRDEMIDAIKQAQAVSSERGRAIRVHGIDGRLHVETKNPDFGTAKIKTSTAWPDGVPAFGMNGRYASEVISQCQGDVLFQIEDAGSPFLVSDGDKDMTRVVMPMRV